tara:strand:+ start:585 stop:1880 length:1296 start_codon:yes stop_codon:yes gene_type:complete
MKEIARELHIFSSQLNSINNLEIDKNVVIDKREKVLLERAVVSLAKQLRILNGSLPNLISGIGGLDEKREEMSQIEYQPSVNENVSVIISDSDRDDFLENLGKSRLSVEKLKRNYGDRGKGVGELRKPSGYAKISNRLYREISTKLTNKGYFNALNKNLRKINSRFVVSTYVSMILFTGSWVFILSLFTFFFLLFFNLSFLFPFITLASDNILLRAFRFSWVILAFPIFTIIGMYFYPHSEAKNLGNKIDQELPFVTIHMSSISSSGVEPVKMFEIILKGEDYKYTGVELKKLMNLVNFHGEDIISALRRISISTSSPKLRELLNGFAVAMSSGGNLHNFLNKHSETLLFDYKLEREKYTKISETFMDIYISIAIAAPMILLMIFVIIGGTGLTGGLFNMSTNVLSLLLIIVIVFMNIFFLTFLRIKQPTM